MAVRAGMAPSREAMRDPLTPDRAAALEAGFVSRIRARVEASTTFALPPGGPAIRGRARRCPEFPPDFEDELRRVLLAEGACAGDLLDRLPRGARLVYAVGGGGFGARAPDLLVVAAVLHPFREWVTGRRPEPLAREAALAVLPPGPVAAAVLSTSGWAEPADGDAGPWRFEPAPGGGFRLSCGDRRPVPAFLAPEGDAELEARAVRWAETARATLVLRGLSARHAASELGVPEPIAVRAFQRFARESEFVVLTEEDGDVVLRRS